MIWFQRRDLATGYIDRALADRGVQASYHVANIGLRTQRIEDVIIGDPANPDLTADWVEVDMDFGLFTPRFDWIRARGVRLRGRLVNGQLKFGEVDKLLPPPSGLPFRLPDQKIDVADAAIRMETPAGLIGIALAGKGQLSDGFAGNMAAVSRRLDLGECAVDGAHLRAAVSVAQLEPKIAGPAAAETVSCGKTRIERPQLALDATFGETLTSWRGRTALRVPYAASDRFELSALQGTLSFNGNGRSTRGSARLAGARIRSPLAGAQRVAFDGRYAISPKGGALSLAGAADIGGLNLPRATLEPATDALAALSGTPLEPIGRALAAAVVQAGADSDAKADIRLVNMRGAHAVRVQQLALTSRSGARLGVTGRRGLTYYWRLGQARIDGDLALSGGGFPATRLTLRQSENGALSGEGRIAPMAAGGARLALGPLRFAPVGGGSTRLETSAVLDGPFSGGRVQGLSLPIRGLIGGGRFSFGESCTPASFAALRYGSLNLGSTRLNLCPTSRALIWSDGGRVRGGAGISGLRLAGRLGSSPLSLTASRFRYGIDRNDFAGSDVAVRLGGVESASLLDLATVGGRIDRRGASGTFAGASGRIGQVPLLVDEGRGGWTIVNGRLSVAADSIRVSDAQAEPRFNPLVSDDFRLTLADNRIDAAGWLKHPASGTQVTRATIAHQLGTGRGNAILDVPGLVFTETFQPEALTRLTTGVIALVRGSVRGQGEIAWGPEGARSTGTFTTENTDLAASFGPVTGLSTTVRFTDLLALQTAPTQEARIARIQAGIDIFDGVIRYQLLPGLKVRVEGGVWPFAGGELSLAETILDFGQPVEKKLIFNVRGVDGARFVEQFEFDNITASGTFDGTIPLLFGQTGARIEGGVLEAREGGGTLSYIGELTDKDLGAYGKLAFDALKSLRYSKLVIGLDGQLDGDFITRIRLDGVARDTAMTGVTSGGIKGLFARRALNQLARIPFRFNITAKGPFRTLLATARSLEDPTLLIESALPPELRDHPDPSTVQPEESETVR